MGLKPGVLGDFIRKWEFQPCAVESVLWSRSPCALPSKEEQNLARILSYWSYCKRGRNADSVRVVAVWKKLTRGQSRQSRRWWCCPRFPAAHQHRCESQTHRWPAPRQKNGMLYWTFSRRICIQYPVLVQGLRPNGASVHWYIFHFFLIDMVFRKTRGAINRST